MMRYFEDFDGLTSGENCDTQPFSPTQLLVDGINLKDLVDGKDVVFKINDDYDADYFNHDDENDEDNQTCSSEQLRTMRGAPLPNMSFKSIESSMVALDDNGYVKKEIIIKGSGKQPAVHSRVIVHYNFYKEYDPEPFDSTYLRGKPCKLRLNHGEIIPGLEIGLASMKKGENSRFIIKWQAAFGAPGCPPRIGKECDIFADVTLLDFKEIAPLNDSNALTEDEINKIDYEQLMREAKNFHLSGSEEFASKNFRSSIRNYKCAIKILNSIRISNDKEEEKMLSLKVKCLVNLAICYNKIGHSERACIVCRDALSIEPNNVKAVFQFGKANLNLSNMDCAEKWLKKAKRLKPDDEDINLELVRLHNKKEVIQFEDTLFCQRAFGKLSVADKN